MQYGSQHPASLRAIASGKSEDPPRSGFAHLRRTLVAGERIPPPPSLAQQLRQLVGARNVKKEETA